VNEREHFEQHPFAQGLSAAQRAKFWPGLRSATFAEKALIFKEGDPAEAVYLIVSGRVGLSQAVPGKGEQWLESFTGGDLLGLSWLFSGERWHFDARTIEPTEVLVLDSAFVRARMDEDAKVGYFIAMHMIRQLYQRLERVRLQRLDVYGGER